MLWLALGAAWAGDLVTFELIKLGETGVDAPRLVATAHGAADLTLSVVCGEHTFRLQRALAAGQTAPLVFQGLPEGEHANVISFTPPLTIAERDLRRSLKAVTSAILSTIGGGQCHSRRCGRFSAHAICN